MQSTKTRVQANARARSLQIDLLKGMAILVVIFQHSMSGATFQQIGAPIYLHQAVGMFMVLAGYNAALSYARRGVDSVAAGYQWPALSRALTRLLAPYLTIMAIEVLLSTDRQATTAGEYTTRLLIGGWGWGSYFVPVIVVHTLLFPIVYRFAQQGPALLLPVAFGVSMAFELVTYHLGVPDAVYEPIYVRYLFAVALGVWLATSRPRPIWVFALAAFGLVYAYAQEYLDLPVPLNDAWASRAAPAAGLALGCVVAGLENLPRQTSRLAWRTLGELGRASYHIFLVQGVYFWRFFHRESGLGEYLGAGFAIVLLCLVGWLFYRAEQALRDAWQSARRPAPLAADAAASARAPASLATMRSFSLRLPRRDARPSRLRARQRQREPAAGMEASLPNEGGVESPSRRG